MVIFILAAISSYLLFTRRTASEVIEPPRAMTSEPIWNWRGDRVRRRAAAAVLSALAATLYASLAAPSEYGIFFEFQNAVRCIASAPETTDALLGALAGLMCSALPPWRTIISGQGAHHDTKTPTAESEKSDSGTPSAELSMGPLLLFAAALASVILAAILAPYTSTLLDRISGVDTPYVKVQFASREATRSKLRARSGTPRQTRRFPANPAFHPV
jgi:hypothetical protein